MAPHFLPSSKHDQLFLLVVATNADTVWCFQTFTLQYSKWGFAKKWGAIKLYFHITGGIYSLEFNIKIQVPGRILADYRTRVIISRGLYIFNPIFHFDENIENMNMYL